MARRPTLTRPTRRRTPAAPTVRILRGDAPIQPRPDTTDAATDADRERRAPARVSSTRRSRGWLVRWWPRRTPGHALAMLAVSLVVLLGGGTLAVTTAMTAQAAPAATPPPTVLTPLPTVDPCTPGSAIGVCQAPTATAPPTPVPSPTLPAPVPTVDTCTPGSPIPACQLPTATPPPPSPSPSPTPCVGQDCIPQPGSGPAPGGTPASGDQGGGGSGSSCGLTDIAGCMTAAFGNLVAGFINAALTPELSLLDHGVLHTPTLDELPGIGGLWNSNWQLVLALYSLLIIAGGIVVMGHESVQTRYSIKEIAPRIVVGFLASALSLFATDKIIQVGNGLTDTILGSGVAPTSLGDTLQQAIAGATTGGLFLILLALVLVVLSLLLVLVYLVRVVATIILITVGPVLVACHALPHTDPLARWWWRAILITTAIPVAQSMILVVAVRLVLNGAVHLISDRHPTSGSGVVLLAHTTTSGGVHLAGQSVNGIVFLLAALVMFWLLFRVPFWMLAALRLGSGRRSLLGSIVRGFLAYKTFGLLGGRGDGGRTPRPSGGGRGGNSGGGPVNPYARTRTTANGQYLLPLPGVRRTRPAPTPRPAPRPKPSEVQGRQLALPLGEDWPENKPVLGRDGQYRLPLEVPRVKPTPPPPSPRQPGPRGGRGRGQQLRFEFDPYRRNRPTRSGQYPLPLGVTRTPRPANPPPSIPPPTPPSTRSRGQQWELPFNPYQGNRPTRSGQYPLPLDGVRRVPPATPTSPPPAAPPRPAGRGGRQLRLPLDLPTPPRSTTPPKPATGGMP